MLILKVCKISKKACEVSLKSCIKVYLFEKRKIDLENYMRQMHLEKDLIDKWV